MTRNIKVSVVAATAFLLVGCTTEEQVVGPGGSASALAEAEIFNLDVGADVILQDGTEWTIWAEINAADPHGISVDNVQHGDVLRIETVSGVAYFAGKSGWWRVLSTVYKATAGVVSTGSIPGKVITAVGDDLPGDGDSDDTTNASKPRDAYGRKLEDNEGSFAEEEGGLIVCMPSAGGPMYAHDANHFKREGHEIPPTINSLRDDRREMKPQSEMRTKCFPIGREYRRSHDMNGNGVLHIYAFDHNYRDNAGSYEIKFRIQRPKRKATG